jgi:hypothetical protein
MNQEIRNRLRNVVTQCRKLLEESISHELEGKYAIFAKKDHVTADPNAPMTHLTEEEQAARRDILDHFGHIKARGFKPKDALDQLVREIAFTHLNRLCAYKMMEAREVYVGGHKFREAVSRGIKSNGFLFYLGMDGHEKDERLYSTGQQDVAYRHFLDWVGGLLSEEIGVLFNPNDPANRLYPRQKTLDEVLDLLNEGGIKPEETELREAWPTIWSQDETIGWVYQYFTPKELRDQARKESAAPRNSYELAFRNQFFTPRYVVEFLTDNTLGRIWYEMRKGDTKLTEQCRYMVRRPTETFLKEGEQAPKETIGRREELSQEELLKLPAYIPHRPKKDPRELKILDPACGSGHFLLYCFDLLQTIYEEAYTDPKLGPELQREYSTIEELRRDVPTLILAYNVHGIDIDLRASQIAALALWLRCQKAYRDEGLKKEHPKINRSNFVCAEPMPGEAQILKDFVGHLEPKLLGQIVDVVFERMKLAGEAGSLLKVEEEIRTAVASAKKQWARETAHALDQKGQPLLFTESAINRLLGRPDERGLFDLSGITDEQFFEQAEIKVVEALRQYAAQADQGHKLEKRLFTDDAERGFAFVDLCHKRYDVVLMNPPFGEPTGATRSLFKTLYPTAADNVAVAFLIRSRLLCCEGGLVGSITDCSWAKKYDYTEFRKNLVASFDMSLLIDLGWSVMDTANVEANLTVRGEGGNDFLAADLRGSIRKAADLLNGSTDVAQMSVCAFRTSMWLPNYVLAYDMPRNEVASYRMKEKVATTLVRAVAGVKSCKSDADFRTWWEVPEGELGEGRTWEILQNGSPFSPYHYPACFAVRTDGGQWKQLMLFGGARPGETQYRTLGLAYGKRTDDMYAYVMPAGQVFSQEGQALFPASPELLWASLQVVNSGIYIRHANYVAGQHKYHNYLNLICLPTKPLMALGTTAKQLFSELADLDACNETSLGFIGLWSLPEFNVVTPATERQKVADERQSRYDTLRLKADREVSGALGLTASVSLRPANYYETHFGAGYDDELAASSTVSYAIGSAFGRWNIALVQEQRSAEECLAESLKQGTLPSAHSMRLPQPVGKKPPIRVSSSGLLPDDSEHTDDIVRSVRSAFEFRWGEHAESVEKDICSMLGSESIREYLRRTSKGGFWDHHISRYSKSRRKAPIYWLLQSSGKNYSVWLYYHHLDRDILFKALVNYVEPKIRLESAKRDGFRERLLKAGQASKEAKALAKELERQEDFLSEMREFEEKLRRAANLHLEPDLNDGVALNIAPLYELVPWKEAKNYWDELLDGEYEWSSIGKQLRQKGLVK